MSGEKFTAPPPSFKKDSSRTPLVGRNKIVKVAVKFWKLLECVGSVAPYRNQNNLFKWKLFSGIFSTKLKSSGTANSQVRSPYVKFFIITLFISLEIDCFYGEWTPKYLNTTNKREKLAMTHWFNSSERMLTVLSLRKFMLFFYESTAIRNKFNLHGGGLVFPLAACD